MNIITRALTLAEEALEELHYSSGTVKAVTLYKSALAAIREARAQEQADQPVSQEYQDHLVNQSFDWAAMAAKHQFMECYRIGLAEMREKCAKVCEEVGQDKNYHGIVAAIRAIKFEGDTGFRPVSEMIAEHKQDPKKAAAIEKAKMRKAEQEPLLWGDDKFAPHERPQEQEPVAYVYEKDVAGIGMRKDVAFTKHVEVGTDLYAAPVRTKDLTDDEIAEITKDFGSSEYRINRIMCARAVIAADRKKNK